MDYRISYFFLNRQFNNKMHFLGGTYHIMPSTSSKLLVGASRSSAANKW